MSHGTHRFRQTELTRAIKAAEAAGMKICGAEISTDGRILLCFGEPATPEQNEWDEAYGKNKSTKRTGL